VLTRRPRKPRGFLKNDRGKPKHNWSNECRDKQRMLDMKREKYFRFDLIDVLEKTANQDNKNLIAATLTNKAAKAGIDEAMEYINRLGDSLEPDIADEIKKLLSRYGTYR
jgi:hypothetical protein